MAINDGMFKFDIWKQRFTKNRVFYSLVQHFVRIWFIIIVITFIILFENFHNAHNVTFECNLC